MYFYLSLAFLLCSIQTPNIHQLRSESKYSPIENY